MSYWKAVVCFAVCSLAAFGQAATGTGTVTDPAGAVLANASV